MIASWIKRKILVYSGRFLEKVFYRMATDLPKFSNVPIETRIDYPRRIINPSCITMGNNVWLGPGSFLNAIKQYPTLSMRHFQREQSIQSFMPRIIIGDRVTSTASLQITAMKEVVIEEDVMFASNVNITDGFHGFERADEPYKYQKMCRIAPIHIKRGCWIGQNVLIMPGVTIGEFTIVGANTVVTKSLPKQCIAFGTPARIVKRWNIDEQKWVSEVE